jgi:uncharacterized protein (TIGR00251 family)
MAILIDRGRDGAFFRVKVQPGAPRTLVKGEHAGALKLALKAPPERGRANEALLHFLAEALGVDRGTLAIASGETSREKRLFARGADAAALSLRLAGLLVDSGRKAKEVKNNG